MSGRKSGAEEIEEAEEAFIDLEDPNIDILDESDLPAEDQLSHSGSDGDAAERAEVENEEDNEEHENGEPQPEAEMEDLNAAPDREPERDDATAMFMAPEGKPVHAITAHPQRPCLFAASGEGEEIYILELQSDGGAVRLQATLTGHSDTVSILSFSPNGEWLASGSLDTSVMLWSTSTWEKVHTLSDLHGEIMTILWHPSSLIVAAGSDDAQAAMWNVGKGSLLMYFVGHRGAVTCSSWSPDAKKLITGSDDGTVSVFNPRTGEQETSVAKDLSQYNAGISALKFVNTDQCVAGCEDGTLHVISLRGKRVVTHLSELHEQAIESLEVNDSPVMLLLSASCDCNVIIWNVSDFSPRATIHVGESVIPALWVRTQYIAAGCSDGDVRVWDGRSSMQEPLTTFMGHRRMIFGLAASGDALATASDDGSVRFFSLSGLL